MRRTRPSGLADLKPATANGSGWARLLSFWTVGRSRACPAHAGSSGGCSTTARAPSPDGILPWAGPGGGGGRCPDLHRPARHRPVAHRRSWQVETSQGPVTARNVVLATNAYTDGLWPGLRQCFSPDPLPATRHRAAGGRGRRHTARATALWDTGPIMFNIRRDAAGRLLIGTMGRVLGTARRGPTRRWAARRICETLPRTRAGRVHGSLARAESRLHRITAARPSGSMRACGHRSATMAAGSRPERCSAGHGGPSDRGPIRSTCPCRSRRCPGCPARDCRRAPTTWRSRQINCGKVSDDRHSRRCRYRRDLHGCRP